MSKRSKANREQLNREMERPIPIRSLADLKRDQVAKPEAKPVKRSWWKRLFRI